MDSIQEIAEERDNLIRRWVFENRIAISAAYGQVKRGTQCFETVGQLCRDLARHAELFPLANFEPNPGDAPTAFLLAEGKGNSPVLYLVIHKPGGHVKPHTHGIWGAYGIVSGVCENVSYEWNSETREQTSKSYHRYKAGDGFCLQDNEIHQIRAIGGNVLALHGYSVHLHNATGRRGFDVNEDDNITGPGKTFQLELNLDYRIPSDEQADREILIELRRAALDRANTMVGQAFGQPSGNARQSAMG